MELLLLSLLTVLPGGQAGTVGSQYISYRPWVVRPDSAVDPVAMVLRSGKEATVQRGKSTARPVREMDLLAEGDELAGGKDGVTIVLLHDGHSERLSPGKKGQLSKTGFPESVGEKLKRKLSRTNLDSLRDLAANSRGGIGVIRRSAADPPPTGISPPNTTTVTTDRPSFSWPAVEGAAGYEIELYSGKGEDRKQEWTAWSIRAHMKYPAKRKALTAGSVYHWQVTALLKDKERRPAVKDAEFSVLEEKSREKLSALKPLVEGDDPDGWLLAATIYEANGVYPKALQLYEKVAKQRPDQGNIHRTLAVYYKRLGLKEKAAAALKQAEKLGVEEEKR